MTRQITPGLSLVGSSADGARKPGTTAEPTEERALGPEMAVLFLGRTLAFAVTFAMPLVLVRVFSQEEYGLYKQLFLVHESLVAILTLGLVSSLYYFIPNDPPNR